MTIKLNRGVHIAVLVVAAMVVTSPFLVHGLVHGDDRGVHLRYQHFFNEQIAGGDLYPRWMPGINSGRGSPIFFIQYPLPYYVAWGLGHIVPNHWGVYTDTREQGLGIVLATILGALFTYAWCTTFVDGLSAAVAAILFLSLPYFFYVDLYSRVSVGEFWALSMMPLSFYFVERRSSRPRRSLAGLAVGFALLLLSHLFTAALFVPVIFAYAVLRSKPAMRFSAVLHTAGALALGTAVAGIYTLTAFAHQHYLHPEAMLAMYGANYSPLTQMFSYNGSMFPDDGIRWRLLGWSTRLLAAAAIGLVGYSCYRSRREGSAPVRIFLAALSILTLALTILAGHLPGVGEVPGALPLVDHYWVERRAHIFVASFFTLEVALLCYWSLRKPTKGGLADALIGMALLSYLMMTRWSLVVWNTFHSLWGVQFPWRINVFLALAASGLAALAVSNLRKWPVRERAPAIVFAIVVWGLVAGGPPGATYTKASLQGIQPVVFQPVLDVPLPVYAHVRSLQEAMDVMPHNFDSPDVIVTAGRGRAKVNMVGPRLMELNAACGSDCTLQIGQFYYPAWRARLARGGPEIPLRAASPGGLMEISLPPGDNAVVIDLPRGWSEEIGPWVSLLSLFFVVVLALSDRPPAG